jgi:hypothetical protein
MPRHQPVRLRRIFQRPGRTRHPHPARKQIQVPIESMFICVSSVAKKSPHGWPRPHSGVGAGFIGGSEDCTPVTFSLRVKTPFVPIAHVSGPIITSDKISPSGAEIIPCKRPTWSSIWIPAGVHTYNQPFESTAMPAAPLSVSPSRT